MVMLPIGSIRGRLPAQRLCKRFEAALFSLLFSLLISLPAADIGWFRSFSTGGEALLRLVTGIARDSVIQLRLHLGSVPAARTRR
jgi:hypothetical protein